MDSLTILTAEPGRVLAKTWRPGAPKPDDYAAGSDFTPTTVPVSGLSDVFALLSDLEADFTRCVVRGRALREGVLAWRHSQGEGATYERAARRWLAVDVDDSTVPMRHDDPAGSAAAWRETLPPGLREAAMVWQYSAKAHVSPTVRGRAWFWLDAPAEDAALRAWAKTQGVDAALYTPVAIHYTAAPLFEGCEDPMKGRRLHWFDGGDAHLDLPHVAPDGPALEAPTESGGATEAVVAGVAAALERVWAEDGHQAWALQFFGWLAAWGWDAADRVALVHALGAEDEERLAKYVSMAERAEPMAGSDAVLDALGADLGAVRRAILAHPNAPIIPERREAPAPTVRVQVGADEDGLIWGTLEEHPADPMYVVPGLEHGPGRPIGVLGSPNATKTLATMQLEVNVALGLPVWGSHPCAQGRVVRMAYEQFGAAQINYARLARAAGASFDDLRTWLRWASPTWFLTDPKAYDRLCRMCEGVAVLVIDPFVAAVQGLDEWKPEAAAPLYMLEQVSNATGVTPYVIHHTPHEKDRARGSGAIEGAFGASIVISKETETRVVLPRNIRRVQARKVERYGFEPFALEITDVAEDGGPWVRRDDGPRVSWGVSVTACELPESATRPLRTGPAVVSDAHVQRILVHLRQFHPRPTTAAILRKAAGLSAENFGIAWTHIVERGWVEAFDVNRRGTPTFLLTDQAAHGTVFRDGRST